MISLTKKRHLTKTCMNCSNIHVISEGWGKQKVRDCKDRIIIPNHCCDDFRLNKQAKYWLKHNMDYRLLCVGEL